MSDWKKGMKCKCFLLLLHWGKKKQRKKKDKSTFCEIVILSAETPGLLQAPLQGGQVAGAAPQGVTVLSQFSGLYLEWNNLPDTYSMLLFPAAIIRAVLLRLFLLAVFPDGF